MAITYHAITSTEAGETTRNLDLPDAVAVKMVGIVHLWNVTARTPSAKWIVIGEDVALADSARLRTITTARKNAIVNEVAKAMDLSHASMAEYGVSLGRKFSVDVFIADATVAAI